MSLSAVLLPLVLMQVGPNPNAGDTLGTPDELLNRPARPSGNSIAAEIADPKTAWLADCLEQVETDPARAHSRAQIKAADTYGAQRVIARHCLGLAATQLGLWDDAEAAFVAAHDETPADEMRAKARFSAMAGNAALARGEPARALQLLRTAQTEAADAQSADLQALAGRDAARALVALERFDEALSALDQSTTLVPQSSEGWLLKATLLRRLERLAEAQGAIEKAVELAPLDLAIGLEAGVIAVLDGRDEAAQASWQSVIDTQPDSLAAQTARGYIAQLTGQNGPGSAGNEDSEKES